MNRLSRDVGLMDDALTYFFTDTLHYFFLFTGYVVVIIVLNPYTLLPLALAIAVVVFLLKKVVPVARDIRLTQNLGGVSDNFL